MKKLIQRLKRSRKNSGFTLVEMVISCGLLGILVLGVTFFITPVLKSAASNEKNVRATLLAETIDNFISRSTRSAYYVQVFTNADRKEAYSDGAIATNEKIKTMQAFVDKCVDSEGNKIFELKCISFSWTEDPQSLESKYMVMSETFQNSSSTVINPTPIPLFEYCFYDGIFPKFTAEQLYGTDTAPEESTSDSASSDTSDEKKPVPALKITTEVFSNQDMTAAEFIGVGYTEYGTIKNKNINANGKYRFYPVVSLDSTDPHSTTFIYYVGRRTMASETTLSSSSSAG